MAGSDDFRWSKFWWQDWRTDTNLRVCPLAARGLWMEMLALMHEGEPRGHLIVAGKSPDAKRLAVLIGATEKEVAAGLQVLEAEGVFSRTPEGVIFSRRMVKETTDRQQAKAFGAQGGNPLLTGKKGKKDKGGVNPPLNAEANPPDMIQEAKRLEAEAEKKEALPSVGTPAAPSSSFQPPKPPSARDVLWSEGLPRLQRLVGGTDKGTRGLMGKILKLAGDDCGLVSAVLFEAEAGKVVEPTAWIRKTVEGRVGRGFSAGPDQSAKAFFDQEDWLKGPPSLRRPEPEPATPTHHAGPTVDSYAEEVPE